jgi:hypothetical protein
MSRYANRSTHGRLRRMTAADRRKRDERNKRRHRASALWLKSVQPKPKKRIWKMPKRRVNLKPVREMLKGQVPDEVIELLEKAEREAS